MINSTYKWNKFPDFIPNKDGKYFIIDWSGHLRTDKWYDEVKSWSMLRPAAVVFWCEIELPIVSEETFSEREQLLGLCQDTEIKEMGLVNKYGINRPT